MIKSIIFDWDGTILNTLPYWLEAYRRAFKRYDLTVHDDEIVRRAFGDRYGHRHFGIDNDEEFIALVTEYAQEILLSSILHEHIELTLGHLHTQGYSLVLLSSSPKVLLQRDLKRHGLEHYFTTVITAEDVTQHKPHPEGIVKAMSHLGVHHTEVMIVGDSDKDIYAGKAAGIKTVLFYPDVNVQFYPKTTVERWQPDHIIDSYVKLLPLVKSL
jgi:HAD superfamily hydrolase (TIGR01509 family)